MPFEARMLFPGLLSESATRVALDAASHPGSALPSSLIRDMGWNAVLIPEDHGGAGGDFQDLAAIVEGLASHAVNLPLTTRCGIVPAILNALPSQSHVHAVQREVAEGTIVIDLAGPLCTSDPTSPLPIRRDENGWRISGTTTGVELTEDCTHLLIIGRCVPTAERSASRHSNARGTNDNSATNPNEPESQQMLGLIPKTRLTGKQVRFHTMDDRQIAILNLDGLRLSDDHFLATGGSADRAIAAGWRIAVAANATDSVCSMGSALSRTITYLLERKQFGHALADFQALRHDVAGLYVTYELSRNLLLATLSSLEHPGQNDDDTSALDLLGLYVGQKSIQFAETIIQLHGGMGMTREMPAAQLATRLLANAMRFADPLAHYQKIDNQRK